jgi:hypothetical protein
MSSHRIAGSSGVRPHDHGGQHCPRRRVRVGQPSRVPAGIRGADLAAADHAAVLLRRDGGVGRVVVTWAQLGRLADPGHVRCRISARSAAPPLGGHDRRSGVRRQRAAGVARPLRIEPGRLPGTTAAEHDAAVGAAGRPRDHDVRAGDRGRTCGLAVGAAAAGVVAGGDRQLRRDDDVPLDMPALLACTWFPTRSVCRATTCAPRASSRSAWCRWC